MCAYVKSHGKLNLEATDLAVLQNCLFSVFPQGFWFWRKCRQLLGTLVEGWQVCFLPRAALGVAGTQIECMDVELEERSGYFHQDNVLCTLSVSPNHWLNLFSQWAQGTPQKSLPLPRLNKHLYTCDPQRYFSLRALKKSKAVACGSLVGRVSFASWTCGNKYWWHFMPGLCHTT